tara:strand:+ start:1917 stop:2141 length:225 start_codon:yes stop_codon:yes gene_type:complete
MNTILFLVLILFILYFFNRNNKENFATFAVPPGTDEATANAIGKAQEVGAQMCSNSELDHADERASKKHNSCSE